MNLSGLLAVVTVINAELLSKLEKLRPPQFHDHGDRKHEVGSYSIGKWPMTLGIMYLYRTDGRVSVQNALLEG